MFFGETKKELRKLADDLIRDNIQLQEDLRKATVGECTEGIPDVGEELFAYSKLVEELELSNSEITTQLQETLKTNVLLKNNLRSKDEIIAELDEINAEFSIISGEQASINDNLAGQVSELSKSVLEASVELEKKDNLLTKVEMALLKESGKLEKATEAIEKEKAKTVKAKETLATEKDKTKSLREQLKATKELLKDSKLTIKDLKAAK